MAPQPEAPTQTAQRRAPATQPDAPAMIRSGLRDLNTDLAVLSTTAQAWPYPSAAAFPARQPANS